jgi:hypothetical protein
MTFYVIFLKTKLPDNYRKQLVGVYIFLILLIYYNNNNKNFKWERFKNLTELDLSYTHAHACTHTCKLTHFCRSFSWIFCNAQSTAWKTNRHSPNSKETHQGKQTRIRVVHVSTCTIPLSTFLNLPTQTHAHKPARIHDRWRVHEQNLMNKKS